MGCGASTESDFTPVVGTLTDEDKATAKRLSSVLGVKEGILKEALPALNRCLDRRLPGRRVYKALDLSILTTWTKDADGKDLGGRGIAAWAPDVAAELKRLSDPTRQAVEKILREGHMLWYPKLGQGAGHLYSDNYKGEAPLTLSYDSGCRLFFAMDPVPGTPMDAMHDQVKMARDLNGKDMSSALYCAMTSPGAFPKAGKEGLAQSLDLHKERLIEGGACPTGQIGEQLGEGQPVLDTYFILGCVAMGKGFEPDATLKIDELWAGMEDLVFAGKVRSLGVCNLTLLQLQGLLEICRIRPSCVQFEHNPWISDKDMEAFVNFAHAEGIGLIAHTPLAQGTRIDKDKDTFDKRLVCEGLTPAQACLRFSVDRGVSVLPGATEPWMISENQATPLDVKAPTLEPLEGGPVGVSLCNISPKWKALCMIGQGGSVKTGEDGHLYATALSTEEAKMVEKKVQVSTEHAVMFLQLKPILNELPRGATAFERRKVITDALSKLNSELGNGALLAQMQVVPFTSFKANGAIPRRSVKAKKNMHVPADTLSDKAKVLFFSQRWLNAKHPDDESNTKHKCAVVAVEAWASAEGVDPSDVYVWFDFCSVEQDDFTELVRGVNALGLYIAASDAFISFDHPEYWKRAWCLSEQMFGDAVRLPRHVLQMDESLIPLDTGAGLKQQLVDPTTGALTVETDRGVIECLSLAAYHMRARLWFNKTAYMMTQYRLEIATDLEAAANLETALIAGVHGVMAPPQPPGKLGAVPTWGKGLQAEQAAQESPPQEA